MDLVCPEFIILMESARFRAGAADDTLNVVSRRVTKAGVSVGLLYRYFPSKQVIIALYDQLSTEFARQTAAMKPGTWRERFVFALEASLSAGVFAEGTAFSRRRVQRAFEEAVAKASDAPRPPLTLALGRVLYLLHLAVLLWRLLDKTPQQRATTALVGSVRQLLPSAALTLRLPPIRRFVIAIDGLIVEALFGGVDAA
jgi:AcrR family transcriptional regulator